MAPAIMAGRAMFPSPHIPLVFLALISLFTVARSECVVRLDISTATQLTFAGTSQASIVPTAFPLQVLDVGSGPPKIGLSGSMYLKTVGSTCPSTAQEWLAAAETMQLTAAPSGFVYKPISMYPQLLASEVMGVPLNISGLELNMTLSSKGPAPATQDSPFRMAVNANITHGFVYSNSPLTGGAQLQALTANNSISTSRALLNLTKPAGKQQASAQGSAQQLNLVLPEFRLAFVSKTSGVVGGKPWSGSLTLSITGALYLSGLVNCPMDCGNFGRCIVLNDTKRANKAAGASPYACECECGYTADPTTGRCEVASGFCPLYGSSSGSNIVMLANTSRSSSTDAANCSGAGGDSVAASAGTCPAKYGFDVFTKTCTKCGDGWGGPGCKLCNTDEACRTKLGKSDSICNTGLLFNERSQTKQYACQLTDQSVAKIVGPVLPLTCTTGGGKQSSGSAMSVNDASLLDKTAQCSISMRLAGMPMGTSAQCTGTGCHFAAGEPSFYCDGVVCDCPSGCPALYLKTFKDVSGEVRVDCDATGSACNIVIGSLNMKIAATCEASECLDPTGPKLVGSALERRTGPDVGPPVIAAVPLFALLLAGLVCLGALVRYMPYLRSKHGNGGGPSAAAAAKGVDGRNGGTGKNSSPLGMNGVATGKNMGSAATGPLGEGVEDSQSPSAAAAAAAATAAANGSNGSAVGSSVVTSPQSSVVNHHVLVSDGSTPRSSRSAGGIAGGTAGMGAVPLVPLLRINVPPRPSGTGSSTGSGQIQELSFFDVTADVRVHRGFKEIVRSALRRDSSSSSTTASAAVVKGDVEQGGVKSSKSTGSLANGSLFIKGDKSPLGRVAGARDPRPTDDDTLPLTEQQQQLSAAVPAADGSSGSNARWRRVLAGVSGCVGSGEVMGIMGPSGGGKSTLLMKLCGGLGGHSRGGEWRSGGVVCLDSVVVPPSLLTAVTALVPQDDSLMRSLTVEECIRYSAALRLDPSLPPAAVNARVESVMDSLGLTKIRRSTVLSGTGVSGVSGGERRRVAIAMELVIDPQVLVLDEPLSGLDSFTALQLMRSLQAVAASGRVVALSLHQPSPALFGALDSAMLLAAGQLVYSGPPSAAAAALAGLGCPVPPGITVAEHLLHVVSDPASLKHVVAAAQQQQQQQHAQLAALPAPAGPNQQQQQIDLHRELSQHAAQQQIPPHLQGAAAATAASLAVGGLTVSSNGGAGFSGREVILEGKPSWFQRLTGGGGQQQQQQYGVGGMMSHQMTNQQPLSPKPSWYHRISAIKPLKGGRPTAAAARLAAVNGGPAAAGSGGGGGNNSKAARLALGLPKQPRPFSRQIGVLFWRGLLDMLRNPLLTAFHALGGLVLGLLVGIIFFGVKSDTSGAQNRVGAIFFALCLLAFTSVTSVDLVQAESSAAGREMQRRYYSPLAYAVTKLVLDGLLLRALPAVLFGVPFYFLMGLNPASLQVLVFLLVLIAFSSTVGALGLGFASSLSSPGKTILVMNLVLLLGVLFGGFLANKDSIPVWLRWISWLSVFRYAWEALVINELSGLDLFLSAPGVSLSLPVKGQVFLQIIGVNSGLFLVDIAVLVAMYFAACVFVIFVLAWRHRVRNG